MLDKRQVLEEQKFRLKQEELRLNLEAEIVKTVAKEQALAAIAVSQRFVFPRVICSPEHWALVLCVPPSPLYSLTQCYELPLRSWLKK